ncbi:hypothetical protein BH23PAT2_BH23PAT2_09800 [soil metagenome]
MPSRNIARLDASDSYYHVYSRGINKSAVLLDTADKDYFLYLLSRHLSKEQTISTKGYLYPHFRGKLELLSFCLMDNHFHLLFYQHEKGAISEMMQSVLTAYTAYYNRRHSRKGPLFESRFKSSIIDNDAYLIHISRYIHLNPRYWRRYPYSSFRHIEKAIEPSWLQSEKVLLQHNNSRVSYESFVADYEDHKNMLSRLKHQLADT